MTEKEKNMPTVDDFEELLRKQGETKLANLINQSKKPFQKRFCFVRLEDFDKCTNMRQLPQEEVDRRNKVLYSIWWEEHKK